MDELYEVYALKYAERNSRTRADSFVFDDDHASPHAMDYYIWVIRNETRTVVVDTGYDASEGVRRGRPILMEPVHALAQMGIDAERVDTVVITHLHYDHAGTLSRFPNACFHLQAGEMAFATGPCMCHDVMRAPYTVEHVVEMVRHVYSGRVVFHDGDGAIAPGLEVACIGGHSRGLQAVRVKTKRGWLVLASDASHYYENFMSRKPFPIVDSVADMLHGFDRIETLATDRSLVIPGHDPLVREIFSEVWAGEGGGVYRLDTPPRLDFSKIEARLFGQV